MLFRKIVLLVKYFQFRLQGVDIKWSVHSNLSYSSNMINKGRGIHIGTIYVRENVSITTNELGTIVVGDDSFFNRNCIVASRGNIRIGNNCIFGPNVCIYDHDHIYGKNGVQRGYKCDTVIIEENCWIGAGVIILSGTHIKRNSIVAAGSVIKGVYEENSLIYSKNEICSRSL